MRRSESLIIEATLNDSKRITIRVLARAPDGAAGKVLIPPTGIDPTSTRERQRFLKDIDPVVRDELTRVLVDLNNEIHERRLEARVTPAPEVTSTPDGRESLYRATPRGFDYTKHTRDGPVTSQLTNWTARIVGAAVRDDGVEET